MGPSAAPLTELLRAELRGGPMTFARFMELALYAPGCGYYRQERKRVGRNRQTDFFTAASSGPVFGHLLVAACRQLLGERDPAEFTWVEIGAEPEGGVLEGIAHPFGSVRRIGVGQPIALNGPCVVFSNELFDAQPFHRFRFRNGAWRELGVALDPRHIDLALREVELSELPTETSRRTLPPSAPEGYVIDVPWPSVDLLSEIADQPWTGLFVAFDYGRSWTVLTEEYPEGTARAYYRHSQSNDLLARPGEQDLTCHVCWDWLTAALAVRGFPNPELESQEAFFARRASTYLAAAVAAHAGAFSREKQAVLQLLHPAHLGQKFQVLHAFRPRLPLPTEGSDR